MFAVQFMVDDKKFGEVLAGLSNKVLNIEFKHMTNVKEQGGAAVATHTAGKIWEAALQELLTDPKIKKSKQFNSDQFRAAIEKLGGKSYASAIHNALEKKMVKRVSRGVFKFV